MALAGVCAVQAFAQDNNCPNGRQVCPEGNAAACAATDNRASDKMYRPQKFTDFAFEGILLDMGQQARMDSLNAAMAPKQCADSACVNKGCKVKGRSGACRTRHRCFPFRAASSSTTASPTASRWQAWACRWATMWQTRY